MFPPRPRASSSGLAAPWAWLGAWLCLALTWPAQAGQVSLEIATQSQPGEGGTEIVLRVSNLGNDTAFNLQAAPLPPNEGPPSQLVEALPPGQWAELELSLSLPPGPPGRRALPLRVDFQDLNQFPFSALAYVYCPLGRERANPLLLQAQPLSMELRGTLKVDITNRQDMAITLHWRAYPPRELALASSQGQMELAPGQNRRLSLEVASLSALAPAQYPLLIWTGYELEGTRLEKILEARVNLTPGENFIRPYLGWWLLAAGTLLALVVWGQVRSRRP